MSMYTSIIIKKLFKKGSYPPSPRSKTHRIQWLKRTSSSSHFKSHLPPPLHSIYYEFQPHQISHHFPSTQALSWPSHTFAQAVLSSGNAFYHLESFYPSFTALLKSPLFYNNFSSSSRQSWHAHSEFPQYVIPVLFQHLLYYNWLTYVCNYKSIKDRDGDYILPILCPYIRYIRN